MNTSLLFRRSKFVKTITYSLMAVTTLVGCSQSPSSVSSQKITEPIPLVNKTTQDMNTLIGNISDIETSQAAVDYLTDYMASRLDIPSNELSVSDTTNEKKRLFKELFDPLKVAESEYNLRSGNVSIQSQAVGVSTHDLASQFDQKSTLNTVSEQELITIQESVRDSIPNIVVDSNEPTMSPLEAMVVTWVAATGDDGTASANSIPTSIDIDSLNKQTNDILSTQFAGPLLQFLAVSGAILGFMHFMDWVCKKIEKNNQGNPTSAYYQRRVKRGRSYRTEHMTRHFKQLDQIKQTLNQFDGYVTFDTSMDPMGDRTVGLPESPASYNSSLNVSMVFQDGEETDSLLFPWNEVFSRANVGDIVFSRGEGAIAREISKLSSWTHAGMIYDLEEHTLLESYTTGVGVYKLTQEDWASAKQRIWSVRRVSSLSSSTIESGIKDAANQWAKFFEDPNAEVKMPYFPWLFNDEINNRDFTTRWADKDDLSSMYCFKLVYNTYLLMGVDLDSNRTRLSNNSPYFLNQFKEYDTDDYGIPHYNAFIGVTGDDIFYSQYVDSVIFDWNTEYLPTPKYTQSHAY